MQIKSNAFNIVQVGAGGTGGYIVPQLARLLHSLKNRIYFSYTIVDGDQVEEKNIARQNFIKQDLGKNKAAVLADRYGRAFELPVKYYDGYVNSPQPLREILKENGPGINILLGCVDNNTCRKVLHECFTDESLQLFYIDAGNEEYDGQVVMGSKCTLKNLPAVGEIFDIEEDFEEQSCAEAVQEKPQNIMANVLAASAVMVLLNNMLANGEVTTHMIYFDCITGLMRPHYINR